MRTLLRLAAAALCLAPVALSSALAQTSASPQHSTDAELNAEAAKADALYNASQTLAALPLFEDLHAQRPSKAGYTERLGMCYLNKSGVESTPEAEVVDRNHARELFKLAHQQGDNSDLWQVMTEKLGPVETASTAEPAPSDPNDPRAPGGSYARAELAFNKGDLAGSVALYKQTWLAFPKFYAAPLYAGDAEYKQNHYDEAGVWFGRAIAIDADYETAHRYWGDCLMKAGKPVEARTQYVEAYLGDPYQKAPKLALRSWADTQKHRFVPPPITLPAPPTRDAKGGMNITISTPSSGKSDPMISALLVYQMNGVTWQNKKFKETYPDEKVYRHSLAEEMDGIKSLLDVLHSEKESKLDASSRSLLALEKDNMLECWILLDNPDQGVAQDYVAYRAKHKDLLRAYVLKYDLHPA